LTDLTHQLRLTRRATKQEIVEMLLAELPENVDDAFIRRLDRFRSLPPT
jgi:hypothetical protein